jgi:tetratricopeptide (TPR) repeat protein
MALDQELVAQIDKYKAILQKDPNSKEFLNLAELYRRLGVAEEAQRVLREGLKKHPNFVEARVALARLLLTQGETAKAAQEFETVIRQDPGNFLSYKLLGEIAMQKNDLERAAERFGAAYKIKPDDQECKVMLDYIGSLLGRNVFPQMAAPITPTKEKAPPRESPKPKEKIIPDKPSPPPSKQQKSVVEEFEELEELGTTPAAPEKSKTSVKPGKESLKETPETVEEFEEAEILEGVEEVGVDDLEEFEPAEIEDEFDEIAVGEEVEKQDDFEFEESELEMVSSDEASADEEESITLDEEEVAIPEESPEGVMVSGPMEGLDEKADEEDIVAEIFQDLSESEYTQKEETEEVSVSEGEDLAEALGLFKEKSATEEASEIDEVGEFEEVEELESADLEEEVTGEVEELEEGEEMGIIEDLEEVEPLEEEVGVESSEEEPVLEMEGEEASSIFKDFGISPEVKEESVTGELEGEGDVFKDFDFDAFEKELMAEKSAAKSASAKKPEVAEDSIKSFSEGEEIGIEEEMESTELEEVFATNIEEEEKPVRNSLKRPDIEEVPSAPLADQYIKQNLLEKAIHIYRTLLKTSPSNKIIRQRLEETLALKSYLEEES